LHKGIAAGVILNKISSATRLTMSGIGGIRATQEVIDLCAKNKIYPKIEVKPVSELNKIYSALVDNTSGTRYVLDIKNTLNLEEEKNCVHPPPDLPEHAGGISISGGLAEACRLIWCCKAKICCCFC